MGEANASSRRRGRFGRVVLRLALGLALGALLIGAALWLFRHDVAHRLLLAQLAALGVHDASLGEARLELGSLELSQLRLGDTSDGPDLELEHLVAHFTTAGLLAGHFDRLEIKGLRARGAVEASGITFGVLDSLLRGGDSPRAAEAIPTVLPASEISMEEAKVVVASEFGPIESSWSVVATESRPGHIDVSASISGKHEHGDFEASLEGAGNLESLAGEIEWRARADRLESESYSLREAALTGVADFAFERGSIRVAPSDCVRLTLAQLEAVDLGRLDKPLSLCARVDDPKGIEITPDGVATAAIRVEETPFALTLDRGGSKTRIEGRLPELTFELDAQPETEAGSRTQRVGLSMRGGKLVLPDQEITASGFELRARPDTDTQLPVGRLQIAALSDRRKPRRFPTLSLDVHFEPATENTLAFRGELANRGHSMVLAANGRHDLDRGAGNAALHLRPVDLGPGGTQIAELVPALGDLVVSTAGTLEAVGNASWGEDGPRTQIELALRDVNANTDLAVFEAVNATVALRESGTDAGQIISIGRLDFGLELTEGLLDYRIEPDGVIDLASARWGFAGGTLETAGRIDLSSDEQPIDLSVRGVDLATLLARVDLDGLSGAGTLDGDLPLIRRQDEILIRGASLRSVGDGGWIRYRAGGSAEGLAGVDANMSNVMTILENFRYDELEIGLDGSASGDVVLKIRIQGRNPDYLDGYPVDFTLNVDAKLGDLIRAEAAILSVPDVVQQRLQDFTERSREGQSE